MAKKTLDKRKLRKDGKYSTGYIPRTWQKWAHATMLGYKKFGNVPRRRFRHACLVFHRRGGKTVWAINHIVMAALTFEKNDPLTGTPLTDPKFAYIAPTYKQAKRISWDYFKTYLGKLPNVTFNESELTIEIHGLTHGGQESKSTIYVMGAENFDAFRGLYLDGYVLDEYADMHPDTRGKALQPTIADRLGWEAIIGTPKGENAFKDVYDHAVENSESWFHCKLPVSVTGLISEEALEDAKREMSAEEYAQEFECDFNAAPSGKYYQKYIDDARKDGRITSVPYDPMVPVITYWDLGFNDTNSIWFFQTIGREIRVIDYYENNGKGFEHYVEELAKKPYSYSRWVLPHDAEHHELSTGRTRVDFMEEFMRKHNMWKPGCLDVLPRTANVNEDIHAVRQVLPICYFDINKCKIGLKALAAYEKGYDDKNQRYKDKPKHNWASHAADSFRQFAVDFDGTLNDNYNGSFGGNGRLNSKQEEMEQYAQESFDLSDSYDPLSDSA